ncbi:hypothetical protein [Kribbella sp. CA-293567]|uniref:hypothetical protein n=1 Tax=Kribbella sp. CA-293567 TaxID=3002436 RepID=UPI0022DCF60D|nr:hypothetical protein [Kribbella sp. CA-293567]WBQ06183.1 hypothetical protein OX958_05100 [Kribbella sp. CA-293567]
MGEAGAVEQKMRARGWWLAGWYGLWVGVNLLLGVVFAYPLLIVLTIALHARAMLFDRPDSPFMPKEIEGGEADGAVAFGVVLLIVMLLVALGSNWPVIRRLRLRTRAAKAGIVLMTLVLIAGSARLLFPLFVA